MQAIIPVTITSAAYSNGNDTNNLFDAVVGTQATIATGETLTFAFDPGAVTTSLALFNVQGAVVTVKQWDTPNGTLIYEATQSLDRSDVVDWYSYFFASFFHAETVVFDNLVSNSASRIEVQITPLDGGAACGLVAAGEATALGDLQNGIRLSIRDYSVKETDGQGQTTLTEGNFAKRISGSLDIDKDRADFVARRLSAMRATAVAYVPTTDERYEEWAVFGYLRDWGIDMPRGTQARVTFQIEGLI